MKARLFFLGVALLALSGTHATAKATAAKPIHVADASRANVHVRPALKQGADEFARSLFRLSESYLHAATPDQAVQLLEINRALLEGKEFAAGDRIRLRLQLARMAYYKHTLAGSAPGKTVADLDAIVEDARATDDAGLLADATDALGLALYVQAFEDGQIDPALRRFREAYALRKKLGDRRGMSESLFHIGLTYEHKPEPTAEDKESARKYYEQSLKIAKANGYKREMSYAHRHLGSLLQDGGKLEAALAHFLKSHALRREIGYFLYLPPASAAIGEVYMEMKDFPKAIAYFRQAYQEAAESKLDRFAAMYLLRTGDAYKAINDNAAARQHYREAQELASKMNDRGGVEQAAGKLESLPTKEE
ncbi:MAG TPA: tetratricopeptide repeat protein [Paucimonas sp.]|nr:tetratricopeptide repeat protein [Paucimonas sp.]